MSAASKSTSLVASCFESKKEVVVNGWSEKQRAVREIIIREARAVESGTQKTDEIVQLLLLRVYVTMDLLPFLTTLVTQCTRAEEVVIQFLSPYNSAQALSNLSDALSRDERCPIVYDAIGGGDEHLLSAAPSFGDFHEDLFVSSVNRMVDCIRSTYAKLQRLDVSFYGFPAECYRHYFLSMAVPMAYSSLQSLSLTFDPVDFMAGIGTDVEHSSESDSKDASDIGIRSFLQSPSAKALLTLLQTHVSLREVSLVQLDTSSSLNPESATVPVRIEDESFTVALKRRLRYEKLSSLRCACFHALGTRQSIGGVAPLRVVRSNMTLEGNVQTLTTEFLSPSNARQLEVFSFRIGCKLPISKLTSIIDSFTFACATLDGDRRALENAQIDLLQYWDSLKKPKKVKMKKKKKEDVLSLFDTESAEALELIECAKKPAFFWNVCKSVASTVRQKCELSTLEIDLRPPDYDLGLETRMTGLCRPLLATARLLHFAPHLRVLDLSLSKSVNLRALKELATALSTNAPCLAVLHLREIQATVKSLEILRSLFVSLCALSSNLSSLWISFAFGDWFKAKIRASVHCYPLIDTVMTEPQMVRFRQIYACKTHPIWHVLGFDEIIVALVNFYTFGETGYKYQFEATDGSDVSEDRCDERRLFGEAKKSEVRKAQKLKVRFSAVDRTFQKYLRDYYKRKYAVVAVQPWRRQIDLQFPEASDCTMLREIEIKFR